MFTSNPEIEQPRERVPGPAHVIEARFPEETQNLDETDKIKYIIDPSHLESVASDQARFPGGETPGLVKFSADTGAAEVSYAVRHCAAAKRTVVAVGPQTSLTGAAVPKGEIVLDMSERKGMSEVEQNKDGENVITVQSGVTFKEVQDKLKNEGLFLPSAPTYDEATVVGGIMTNAGGARGYKYGKTRNFVDAIEVVLATGEVLDIERGQYRAHEGTVDFPGGYFDLVGPHGSRRIPVPTYEMPDVPKVSAGYYAEPGMDLIDLFIGSEGTLGVITEARIKVIKEPPTWMALVLCESDEKAFELISRLREQEAEKRETLEPGGISAVEYIGLNAANLVIEHGIESEKVKKPPRKDMAYLIVQIEDDENAEGSMGTFFQICDEAEIGDFDAALPDDRVTKESFTKIRESVPITVNEQVSQRQVTKVGADPCVKPEHMGDLLELFYEELQAIGIDENEIYHFGHGEGNPHVNLILNNMQEVALGLEAVLNASKRGISELHGVGTSEHGVGKNDAKQKLLVALYGQQSINQMRVVKQALDPQGILAPGNIFPLAA